MKKGDKCVLFAILRIFNEYGVVTETPQVFKGLIMLKSVLRASFSYAWSSIVTCCCKVFTPNTRVSLSFTWIFFNECFTSDIYMENISLNEIPTPIILRRNHQIRIKYRKLLVLSHKPVSGLYILHCSWRHWHCQKKKKTKQEECWGIYGNSNDSIRHFFSCWCQ